MVSEAAEVVLAVAYPEASAVIRRDLIVGRCSEGLGGWDSFRDQVLDEASGPLPWPLSPGGRGELGTRLSRLVRRELSQPPP